jgi:hypothetical protein
VLSAFVDDIGATDQQVIHGADAADILAGVRQ